MSRDRSAGTATPAPAEAGVTRERGSISISQIIPDDRNNLLIVVATEKAYQQILALVRRLDQQSALGDNITDRVHVMPLENANAEDVAGTLGGLGAGVSKGGKGGGGSPAAAGQKG